MSNIINNMHLDHSASEYKSQDDNSRVYENAQGAKEEDNQEIQMNFQAEEYKKAEVLIIEKKKMTKSIFTIDEDEDEDGSLKSSQTGEFKTDNNISDIINMSIKSQN